MKKKIIALSVAFVLVAVAAIGATLSFLTDTQDIKNVYQIGDIDVTAYETVKHTSGDGKVIADETTIEILEESQEDHLYSNIQPGDEMKKVVTVTNESTTNAAYIAVAVKMGNHYTFNNKIDTYYEAKYGVNTDEMEALFDSIFTGHDLTYLKNNTNSFRLYPSAEMYDQAGSGNYNQNPLNETTLLAVDAVKASSNKGAANGFGAYAENMFKAGDADVTSTTDYAPVPDFYAVKNDVANGEYDGERLWVYYYYVPAGESFDLDLTITCPDVIDNYSLDAFQDMYLNVQVSAIQVTGFDSARDAFLELNKTYPYNAY
ncbi:MAG: hypothetical protein IJN86_06930 [Clostridia bacterium]|nr:hypothetical protein [Clostridia bacterium]